MTSVILSLKFASPLMMVGPVATLAAEVAENLVLLAMTTLDSGKLCTKVGSVVDKVC
jgi:hypothetical protein